MFLPSMLQQVKLFQRLDMNTRSYLHSVWPPVFFRGWIENSRQDQSKPTYLLSPHDPPSMIRKRRCKVETPMRRACETPVACAGRLGTRTCSNNKNKKNKKRKHICIHIYICMYRYRYRYTHKYELSSELLVYPFITPTIVPYINPLR